jgi:hypothetical protein
MGTIALSGVVELSSFEACNKIDSVSVCVQPGWNRVNLARSGGEDGQNIWLDYCDAYSAVEKLWKDPAHKSKLILKPQVLMTATEGRRYRGAHTGRWWNEMQVGCAFAQFF